MILRYVLRKAVSCSVQLASAVSHVLNFDLLFFFLSVSLGKDSVTGILANFFFKIGITV